MATDMAVPQRPVLRWGVNLQAAMYAEASAREAQLQRLQDLGVTVGRMSIPWSWVERTQGVLNWSYADAMVAVLLRHGIQPLVEISNMPPWARPAGAPETWGPADGTQRAGFANFCAAVAARFAGKVYAYEIWNEANGGTWAPAPNMDDYSQLFVAAYHAIKASDPLAPVITTGMAGNCGFIDALPWTRDFVKTPAMALADGLGFHPYSNGDGKVSGMLLEAAFVRQTLDAAGFSHVPMYMTETGISTGGSRGVSEQMQATVVDVTADWLENLRGVNCVLWYCDMDSAVKQAANPDDTEGHFGLWRVDGSPKPAVANFAQQVGRSLPAGQVATNWWSYDGTSYISLTDRSA